MHVSHAQTMCCAMEIKQNKWNFMIFNIFNMKFNLFLTYTKNIAQQSLIILFPVMRKVSSYSIQLISALKMNIIIVHPWDVVFPRAFAGINCFIIVKLDAKKKFDKCEHFCKWTARMVPLGTPAVVILYILTSRTRFRSWSFYLYRKRFGDLDHCFPGH
jgi:hypothetical protein